ncbi:MAG: response regulator [Elusimicrobiota bacterium]
METNGGKVRGPGKILVVDDDQAVRRMLSLLLGSEAEVLLAKSGEEALRMLTVEKPRLMLLDMVMPRMGGLEVLKAVRGTFANMNIIVLTGMNDMDTAKKALELGADEYVTKPFDLNLMKETVKRFLAAVPGKEPRRGGIPWRSAPAESAPAAAKHQVISRTELKAMIDDREQFHLWNVLPPALHKKDAHIAGSRWVSCDSIAAQLAGGAIASKKDAVVVYGAGPDCAAARQAVATLVSCGYGNVYIYEGGLKDWSESGLPLGKSSSAAKFLEIK